jgi:hypothetical protein
MTDDRELGPELKAEGRINLGGDDIMWIHTPSSRCLVVHTTYRHHAAVPCWGPEPEDPHAEGYFVACRVHDDGGEPMFGDAFWVQSYATALRVARQIRVAILREGPVDRRRNRLQYAQRQGEAWAEIARLCENNARLTGR